MIIVIYDLLTIVVIYGRRTSRIGGKFFAIVIFLWDLVKKPRVRNGEARGATYRRDTK